MNTTLRLLIAEDNPYDAELMLHELRRTGFDPDSKRVETEHDYRTHLEPTPDIILSDFSMPEFDALRALAIVKELRLDIPVIVVSGSIGEERAVKVIQSGATDYVVKDRLGRLGQAVSNALEHRKLRFDKHRVEQSLSESEMRFQQLADCMPALVWSARPDGYVDYYNKRWYEYTGVPEEAGGDNSWIPVLHPDDVDICFRRWYSCVKSGEPHEVEIRFKEFRTGEYRWHLVRGLPMRNSNGTIVRWCGTCTDIHDQKEAEEVDRRLAAIVESSQDAIISKSLDGIVLTWNAAAESIYGYPAEEMVGQPITKLLHDRAVTDSSLAKVAAGESIRNLVVEKKKKDGTPITVSLSMSPIKNHSGAITAACVIARDVTEQRRLEEQLRQANKMDGIGCLAGGVAHDFNNLLTVINGRAQLAMGRLKPGEKSRNDLELIYKTGERAAALTRQLLAFSRQQVLQPIVLDLNIVARDMEKLLRRLVRENIELITELAPDLRRIKADPGQIEQVILNLVVNAGDAMPGGGKLIIETCNVELSDLYSQSHSDVKPGDYVMLAVSDTGCGMDATVKSRIFEPFYTTKPLGKGTGLGLATVFGVVKQSNGHIEVYSEVGKGTTFKIYLPQTLEQTAALARESGLVRAIGDELILVVEDQEGVRDLLRDLLEMNGYTVLVARNGVHALQIAADHKGAINLLLTDVVMPEMGGPEVAQRMKTLHPETKVLYTSGYTDHAIVRNGTLDASVAFIQKPFTPIKLAAKVREALDKV